MIEKSFLPARFLMPCFQQLFPNHGTQRLSPFSQREIVRRECDEEMNVIRHQNVATHGDAMIAFRTQTEGSKGLMTVLAN